MGRSKKSQQLKKVSGQIRLLMHKLAASVRVIHGEDSIPVGQRAILEDLKKNGPQTIPYMAQKRPVSRQHLLSLVTPLKEGALVEYQNNPIHKRSFLVALSTEGDSLITKMMDLEEEFFQSWGQKFGIDELDTTTAALEKLIKILNDLEHESPANE